MSILQDIFRDHYEEIVNVSHRHCVFTIDEQLRDFFLQDRSLLDCLFHYNRHEDDSYVEETLPVMEFIERLIRHIPEKHFKMIRYAGVYARHREIDHKLHRAISREKHHIFRSFNQWRTAILSAFGYDPMKCECGAIMLFLELYLNHKRISLEERMRFWIWIIF